MAIMKFPGHVYYVFMFWWFSLDVNITAIRKYRFSVSPVEEIVVFRVFF